jgi:hypothetical protein
VKLGYSGGEKLLPGAVGVNLVILQTCLPTGILAIISEPRLKQEDGVDGVTLSTSA